MATSVQRIQLRRDTAANWTTNNPTLQAGEIGIETDTNREKIGNGTTAWTSLGYSVIRQAAKVNAVNATATLTIDQLKGGIITSTTAAAVTMTLPTGTLTEGGFHNLYEDFVFMWSVINTGGTNAVTVAQGTDHTVVGNMTVAANSSGRFATRRTNTANTFVTYRIN